MKWLICILAVLYGILSVLAPLTQLKEKDRRGINFIMLAGGVLLIIAAILKALGRQISLIPVILGAVMISVAAFCNGRKNGKVHIPHHIVRGVLALALIVGFAVW